MPDVPTIHIRRATIADAAVIARHRADMFADMGDLPDTLRARLETASTRALAGALHTGDYVGWLCEDTSTPERRLVAGGGVLLRARLPGPRTIAGTSQLLTGREAIVYNMFTEREWRRRGLARRIMDEILAWARSTADVDSLVLHASDEGRPLYASLGFVATNEMRFNAPLSRDDAGAQD